MSEIYSKKQFIPAGLEFAILLFALVFSLIFTGDGLFVKCFSLGNGLVAFQCLRMLWTIDKRAKYYSIAIALTQIAVGSQVILGYGFIVVISAVFLLLPKSLYNLQADEEIPSYDPFSRNAYWVFSHKLQFLGIAVAASLFFVLFPRVKVFNTLDIYGFNKKVEITKPVLTTSLSGDSQGDEIIFRIYGKDIGYLKLFTLDTFDGNIWTASPASYLYRHPNISYSSSNTYDYRKVDIAAKDFTSRFLPSDGYVTKVSGDFFYEPLFSQQGNIIITEVLGAQNKYFEYWTINPPPVFDISNKDKKRYLSLPKISERVKGLLNEITGNDTDLYESALKIQNYLASNFTYEVGSPELNSKNPIDDFIFRVKKGHCGRFASALAVFLRMKNIPSRVVIGYYTNERNQFGNLYNVRNSNAHAWVESYFQGKGWTILDATPADQRAFGAFKFNVASLSTAIYDFVEYVWYSKIINFTSSDQKAMFESTLSNFKNIIHFVKLKSLICIAVIIMIIIALFFFGKLIPVKKGSREQKKLNVKYAEHFYSQMLKMLARNNLIRESYMTPLEFAAQLRESGYKGIEHVDLITDIFCKVKYGEEVPSLDEKKKILTSLEFLKQAKF